LLDEEEFDRWMEMARKTLKSAERDLEGGDYNWACFKAQQSAGFAVKGLLHGLGLEAYGHSISALLTRTSRELVTQKVMQAAKSLDKYYVPTRYPNAWSEGVPAEYYTEEDSRQAIKYAGELKEWVENVWKSLKRGG